MPPVEPPESLVEIILPGGSIVRPDRRRAATLRPYSSLDGGPAGAPSLASDRRRRRRAVEDGSCGRRLDVES
jgi:hypothetical protein